MNRAAYFEQGRRAGYVGEPQPDRPAQRRDYFRPSWQWVERVQGWHAGRKQREAERQAQATR